MDEFESLAILQNINLNDYFPGMNMSDPNSVLSVVQDWSQSELQELEQEEFEQEEVEDSNYSDDYVPYRHGEGLPLIDEESETGTIVPNPSFVSGIGEEDISDCLHKLFDEKE